ncbi:hypothetical protein QMK50_04280 [Pseudomonas sp. P5_152]|uniref:hypothetical protein n=1 Tax=Pseudomonas sp. P5_152 TaxID=3043442 RepID=UPI002A35C8A4|nr:hypothetical protein [Pseudomonas sp. P5_152]MDX9664200.1 hypothetical protein [Pseudomonas sp. P5_152]
MITTHPDLLYLAAWAVVLLLVFTSEAIVLAAAYFRLGQMEDHFIASHLVDINRKIVGNGTLGRMKRVKLIGSLTGRFTLIQTMDPYAFMEAEILPDHLKKWAQIPGRIMRMALLGAGLLVLLFSIEWLLTTLSRPANDLTLISIATLIACFVVAVMAVLVRISISTFKLDELEDHLKESYFVARNRRVMGNSMLGRYSRLSHISTMLLLSEDFLSKSDPYAIDEIACFPLSLRRLVTIPNRMLAYSIAGFAVVLLSMELLKVVG